MSTDELQAPIAQPRRSAGRWLHILATVLVGFGCLVLPGVVYELRIAALATPETAMFGPARVEADWACFWIFALAFLLLAAATVGHTFSRATRALAVVPALVMLPVYASFRSALERVEQVPAFTSAFATSGPELSEVADAVGTGQPPHFPVQAGAFRIVAGEKLGSGAVVLYTHEAEDDGARWGFVRYPDQQADTGPAALVGLTGEVGADHRVWRLDSSWFVLYHDYWFSKRGWS